MKAITVSDADYDLLIALSKELQEQENDFQAFPYFWSPGSAKKVIGTEDDEPLVYDGDDVYTLRGYAEHCTENDIDLWDDFADTNEIPGNIGDYNFDGDNGDWKSHLEYSTGYDIDIVYQRDEMVQESNFSLFKSDVKGFIEANTHHLGDKPHTYANTIFRMPKMEALIKAIYRLNKSNKENVNPEAARFMEAASESRI